MHALEGKEGQKRGKPKTMKGKKGGRKKEKGKGYKLDAVVVITVGLLGLF